MSAVLRTEELRAGYGPADVLHGVDLVVEAGETVCVLGPNGAGKTTVLRTLSGTAPRSSGRVLFDGADVSRMRDHARVRAGIVHVPEGRRNVIPTLPVSENLTLAGGRLDASARRARIAEVEALFPALAERRGQRAGTMSGGQQQMLAIGLGLMLGPRLLMVDEPSAGLSPALVEEVIERLSRLRDTGIAMLVAEQRVDLALRMADRGYVMESGRVVAQGAPDQLRSDPRLSESYLGGA